MMENQTTKYRSEINIGVEIASETFDRQTLQRALYKAGSGCEVAGRENSERDRDRSGPRDRLQHRSPPSPVMTARADCGGEKPEPEGSCPLAEAVCIADMAAIVTDGYISRREPAASRPELSGPLARLAELNRMSFRGEAR